MHLQLSTPPARTHVAPRFLFTCIDPVRGSAKSQEVLEALQRLSPKGLTIHIFSSPQELARSDMVLAEAVALFDESARGFYTLRNTRRFTSVRSQPPWAVSARWAVALHNAPAERIARQLAAIFGEKFAQLVQSGLIRDTPLPRKPRKPRKPRMPWKRRRRGVDFA